MHPSGEEEVFYVYEDTYPFRAIQQNRTRSAAPTSPIVPPKHRHGFTIPRFVTTKAPSWVHNTSFYARNIAGVPRPEENAYLPGTPL